jgi:hypothetical protein
MTDTFRDLIIRTSKNKEEAKFRIALHEALVEFAFDKNEEGKMTDDLVRRLRDPFYTPSLKSHTEAADRIEQLDASSEGWKEIADEYFDAICDRNTRIEKLESALRELSCKCTSNCDWERDDICPSWTARKALEGKND